MRSTSFFNQQEVPAVAAQAGVAILPASASREFLQIQNVGGAAAQFRFGSAPDATNGFSLPAGATVTYDVRVPTGALFASAGATLYVMHG